MSSTHIKFATIIQSVMLITLSVFFRPGIAAPDIAHLEAKDPHFGEALLYFYQGNYLSSMAHLAASEKMQQLPAQKEDGDLLLGILQYSYGMNNVAKESFFKILQNKKYSKKARDIAALYAAYIYYKQGARVEANNMVLSIGDTLPARLKKEKDLLWSNILIDKNQLPEAEKILSRLNSERDVDILSLYGQHNLAVAMLKNGQSRQGISLLQKISEKSFHDNERRTLQDKVNLVLGYTYLQTHDMNSAIGYFEKIRINGPFSLRALLGLGFAENALRRHQRALVPWLELQKGDLREAEVQESFLLISEALFKLESYKKSQNNYKNAVSRYKSEIDALSSAIEATRAGKIITNILTHGMLEENLWNNFIMRSSTLPEARYFPWYMRDEEFRQAISLYREALDLRRVMASQKDSLNDYELSPAVTAGYAEKISSKITEIDNTLTKIESHIQSLALNWLENRAISLNSYLSEANIGSAKVYHHAAERGDQ